MRIGAHGLSSILAIAGGGLFLVLPLAFLNGTVSIIYVFFAGPACTSGIPSPTNPHCPIAIVPMLGEMALYMIFLGVIGILLGFLVLKLSLRPRVGFALGLAFSLGSMALLFWTVTLQVLETLIITPAGFLLFPMTFAVVMAGATVLFSYELARRGREGIDASTS